MKKIFLSIIAIALLPIIAFAQDASSNPSIMVVPSNAWCNMNNFMSKHDGLGKTEYVPMYEEAFINCPDLKTAISTINSLMEQKGFPLNDMEQELSIIKAQSAEDLAKTRNIAEETMLDQVKKRVKSDIVLELTYKVNTMGMQKNVSVTLRALDAYVGTQVATLQNETPYTIAFNLGTQIQVAIEGDFANFCDGLSRYFEDIKTNGRKINLNIKTEADSEIYFEEEEVGDKVLSEVIEEWLSQNGKATPSDASETTLTYKPVRIPLVKEDGAKLDPIAWGRGLAKHIRSLGYKAIPSVRGIGDVTVMIGRK